MTLWLKNVRSLTRGAKWSSRCLDRDFCSLHFPESPHPSRQLLSAFNYNPTFLPSSSDWVSFARVNVSFDTLVISGNLGSRHLSIWRGGELDSPEKPLHTATLSLHYHLAELSWDYHPASISWHKYTDKLSWHYYPAKLSWHCHPAKISWHHHTDKLSWHHHPAELSWLYHPAELFWHHHSQIILTLSQIRIVVIFTLTPCSAFPLPLLLLLLLLTSEWFAPIHWKPLNAALTWKAIHTTISIVRNVWSTTVLCGFS